MIYLKRHDTDKGDLLAMCDEKLLGKVHKDKMGAVLDLETYADFYKGELLEPDMAKIEIEGSDIYSANIVGKESVGIIVGLGLAEESEVRVLAGVPSVQIFKMV